jgi:vitamin K-dependent gamma-carboxylase
MTRTRTTSRWITRSFAPRDGASLAVFRIAFGLIMLWEVWRYTSRGWVEAFYLEPAWLFPYAGFAWVTPWPGAGMHWHFVALGTLAAMIALGLFYRLAMPLFLLGFTYVFLLDQARYLNHFYLVILFAFLLCLVPAERCWSLDAWRRGPVAERRVPAWSYLLLQAQLEIVLLYAGIVKINADWLAGEPLGVWLADSADLPLIGPLLLDPAVVDLAAWGSIALHLVGAPLLLYRRTRLWVFLAYACFHLLNSLFWQIGIFPWFTIAATLLFFEPDWPRRLWGLRKGRTPQAALPAWDAPRPWVRSTVIGLAASWLLFQALLPLRHLAYPGAVSWTEEGHVFAWQMMLRDKSGETLFLVRDPAGGQVWQVDPADYLTPRQVRKMAGRPEMIRLFAHRLEAIWRAERGLADVEVRALTAVSLNGRPSQPLVDPARDLTRVPYSLAAADWILPLATPLPPPEQRWFDDFDETLDRLLAASASAGRE